MQIPCKTYFQPKSSVLQLFFTKNRRSCKSCATLHLKMVEIVRIMLAVISVRDGFVDTAWTTILTRGTIIFVNIVKRLSIPVEWSENWQNIYPIPKLPHVLVNMSIWNSQKFKAFVSLLFKCFLVDVIVRPHLLTREWNYDNRLFPFLVVSKISLFIRQIAPTPPTQWMFQIKKNGPNTRSVRKHFTNMEPVFIHAFLAAQRHLTLMLASSHRHTETCKDSYTLMAMG